MRSLMAAMVFTAAVSCNVAAQLTCPAPKTCKNFASACGVERWPVKTGTDAGASSVSLIPQSSSISSLSGLPAPPSLPSSTRVAPTETTVFAVNATLTGYKLESDGDYFVVISDASGKTMDVEIPSPSCVTNSSPWRCFITVACSEFEAKLTATTSFQTANMPVLVKGVGMFDLFHGQTGQAPNGIELHPLLDLQFTDPALSAIGRNLHFRLGKQFQLVVATFTDADPSPTLTDFSATINWGDGTSSNGIVSVNTPSGFAVTGIHTYTKVGGWTVAVQINDAGGASATATSRARQWPKPLSY